MFIVAHILLMAGLKKIVTASIMMIVSTIRAICAESEGERERECVCVCVCV